MKNLKLFPKIFLYTLILMLLIAFFASGMIYLLAPIIASSDPLSPGLAQDIPGIAAATIPRNEVITKAILGSLPYTIGLCVILSLLCAFFFSRAITKPIKNMLLVTQQMATLEKNAACSIQSGDEIGILSRSINELYQKLLFTIEHLREEKDKVSEVERQKVDFLRAASHELKTPVTALNATLENMIMEVGKYKDYNTYLPLCKEQTEQIGKMVTEILDASKLSASISSEETQSFDIANYLKELCGQYQLISNANGQQFKINIASEMQVCLPPKTFAKAISNILANAVAYTEQGKAIVVTLNGHNIIVENECQPIPAPHRGVIL